MLEDWALAGVENAYPLIRMVKFVETNAAKWGRHHS